MDIDFPLVLVVLTFATGAIYLLDLLVLKSRRELAYAAAGTSEQSQQTDELEAPREPWLIETSKSFFPVLALVLVLRSFLVEPFQIPSGSMLPTLEVGDFILVNKYTYGLRLPVAGTKVIALNDPKRGDVMVFKFPGEPKVNYIKRVIGEPGDVIRYQNKQLFINGELVPEQHLASLPSFKLFEEQLGPVSHKIYEDRYPERRPPNFGEGQWTVPADSYFVMGDNRDNSNDSRFWGFVKDELVVGKAFAIWMHWPSLTSLPSFGRAGSIQ